MSVAINPPKTPVTKGSNGIAAATVPNICKMPGPPAPFVPAPLPNIGRSSLSPKGYSKKVKIQKKPVAIKGATFASQGDVASKGTGGGMVSANTHGPTKFVGPGALDVKIEGKNVQLLSDPMLNNCGPSGSPPNAATLVGVLQGANLAALWGDEECPLCGESHEEKLEESETGDANTKSVATDYTTHAKEAAKLYKSDDAIGMLGVIQCDTHSHFFVAQSGTQVAQLRYRLADTGWHYYPNEGIRGDDDVRLTDARCKRFADCVDPARRDAFVEKWKDLYDDSDRGITTQDGDPYNPPGSCAAQQAMLLTLDHGCRPKFMTERWSRKRIYMHVRELPDGAKTPGKPEKRKFSGEQAVPPCGTCEVVLTALMCNQRGKECVGGKEPECGKKGC